MFSSKFIASIVLAIAFANQAVAVAVPEAAAFHTSTHRRREIGDLKLEVYAPASSYEVFGEGLDHPLGKRADESLEEAAVSFVEARLGANTKTVIEYKTGYTGEVASHAYIKQTHEGIPFSNAVSNVAFNSNNKIVAFGNSLVKPVEIASSTPTIDAAAAISASEAALGGKYNDHPVTLEYLALASGKAALVHVVQVQDEENWFESFVDAHTGEVLSVTDFVADASYRVIPIQFQSVPDGFQTLVDPQDIASSPLGWHSTAAGTTTTTTAGNNAIAYKGTTAGVTTQSSANLNFVFNHNAATAPTTAVNLDAARTNAFYVVNRLHDILYKYGWTESAYNFQNNNLGKGGAGNDRVTVAVQAPGSNNANFATPADGQSGRMNMFLWTYTTPNRDGDLSNDISKLVAHELGHGLSNRMTGGGTARCLQTTEAGGMGEGWSDSLAEITQLRSGAPLPDFSLASYMFNNANGLRTYKYSTSATTNPDRYATIRGQSSVHRIGSVWANILHQVLAALVDTYGFNANALSDPTLTSGNSRFLHLFVDSFALQPCNPTFVTARNAWIQADANRYGGANRCLLYKAFASRGLGAGAVSGTYTDSTTLPTGC